MAKIRSMKTLPLDGGTLAFHFINTVNAWRGVNLHEYLSSYQDVILWCYKLRLFPAKTIRELAKHAQEYPEQAKSAYLQLVKYRKLFYSFFSALAAAEIPSQLLSDYNRVLSIGLSHLAWNKNTQGYDYSVKYNPEDLLLPMWAIIKDAQHILQTEDWQRIKECQRCGWIFLDATKNNQRRWCNPSTCGSVEKLKKYYEKHRKAN